MKTQTKEKVRSNGEKFEILKLNIPKRTPRFVTKQGIHYSESMQLMFRKMGVTAEELQAINKKSLQFTKAMAEKYGKQSKIGNIETVKMIRSMARPGGFHILSSPNGFPAPEPQRPPDIRIDAKSPLQHLLVHAEGNGTGWLTHNYHGNDDQTDQKSVTFNFPKFGVPLDGFYLIKIPLLVSGQYFLIADDGFFYSKEARCWAGSSAMLTQGYTQPTFNFEHGLVLPGIQRYSSGDNNLTGVYPGFLEEGDDNINRMDVLIGVNNHFISDMKPVWLKAFETIDVTVSCWLGAMAKGDGSVAEINCTPNSGGILCPGISLWRV